MRERFWREVKIVKSNKDHECEACGEVILKDSRTLVEAGRNKNDGYFSNYFHTSNDAYGCDDQFIDVLFINKPEAEKIKNPQFFGQISYNHRKEETNLELLEERFGFSEEDRAIL